MYLVGVQQDQGTKQSSSSSHYAQTIFTTLCEYDFSVGLLNQNLFTNFRLCKAYILLKRHAEVLSLVINTN